MFSFLDGSDNWHLGIVLATLGQTDHAARINYCASLFVTFPIANNLTRLKRTLKQAALLRNLC
ncbi:MAG TPA: hypothetical protein VKB46_26345, partial [Pyrinomonadaceae bacterium]|nr:hypothetical protein [Pyrinomonadaceae bacterium]